MEETIKRITSSEEANVEEDRMSLLPADLQYCIMSRLPIHEAFKMSLQSRMWSAMWTSLPVLMFDYRTFPEVDDRLNCFLDFIRRTLARHDETDLTSFMLFFWPRTVCDAPIESEWVTFAVQHNVRNINLWGKLGNQQKLPDCLFTSRSIVTMVLSVKNVVLEWPKEALLPNLKTLILIDMILSENFTLGLSICPQIETLLIQGCDVSALKVFSLACSRLKYLIIYCCQGIEGCEVKLITPSLEKFDYWGGIARDYEFTHMGSLFMATIIIVEIHPAQTRDVCYPSAVKLARGVRAARCLLFNELFIKFIKVDHPSRLLGNMLFDKLEKVFLHMWPSREQVLTVFLLLNRCPELSTLDMVIARHLEPTQNVPSQGKFEIPFMLNRLRSVTIAEFGGSDSEMELIRAFLQHCPSLRELKITVSRETNDSGPEMLQLINQRKGKIMEMLQSAKSSSLTITYS